MIGTVSLVHTESEKLNKYMNDVHQRVFEKLTPDSIRARE